MMEQKKKRTDLSVILAIVAISFLQGLQYSVSPVLGKIHENYPQTAVSTVQMLITVPAIPAMIVSLLSGRLVTRVSKKKLLLSAALISGISGIVPYFIGSFSILFLSRFLYGIGLGFASALNSAVVADFFTGEKRVKVMGIQAASIGAGMVLITTAAGMLGTENFRNSYWINMIGFLSFAVLAVFLPDTGKATVTEENRIRLNRTVFMICLFGFLEFLFLITFTTNIAMHLTGDLKGSASTAGYLTGIFSAAQIVIGLLLGNVSKICKRMTLPAAMISFCLGGILLVAFPQYFPALAAGAVLCGFSQGIFIPTAYVEVAGAVNSVSVTMASACFASATCIGQMTSPFLMNHAAKLLFGNSGTGAVYRTAVIGMLVAAFAMTAWIRHRKK